MTKILTITNTKILTITNTKILTITNTKILTITTTRLMLTERKLNITNLYPVPPMQVNHILFFVQFFGIVPGENAWKPFDGGSHGYSQ